MKIRIEFEIPNWTRWIAVGLAGGTVLGYGVANVHAGVDAGTSVATWQSGERLTASKLNQSFSDLQNAINAQQATLDAHQAAINSLRSPSAPDCPVGYTRDAAVTTFVLCRKGLDEVVKVGSGGAAFWVDRYEASVWNHADGTGQQYGIPTSTNYPSSFPVNGQYTLPLYALSIAQVIPSASLTWFQAVAACDASGKRLINRQEWFRAAKGTIDPDANDGTDGHCFTSYPSGGDQARMTGKGTSCRSSAGAEDMIGNLWELSDEWHAAPGLRANGTFAGINVWSGNLFNSDITVNIASQARTTDDTEGVGMPAAANRGGSFNDPSGGGLFALDLMSSPNYQQGLLGFRCVISN